MSYKSREKKRRKLAAIGNVRAKHGETMKGRHYLTITTRDCCCNACGTALRKARRDRIVYRYEPREVLCPNCATERGIHYRLSRAIERQGGR